MFTEILFLPCSGTLDWVPGIIIVSCILDNFEREKNAIILMSQIFVPLHSITSLSLSLISSIIFLNLPSRWVWMLLNFLAFSCIPYVLRVVLNYLRSFIRSIEILILQNILHCVHEQILCTVKPRYNAAFKQCPLKSVNTYALLCHTATKCGNKQWRCIKMWVCLAVLQRILNLHAKTLSLFTFLTILASSV